MGLYATLSAIGGFLGYVMRTLDSTDGRIVWSRAFLETFASGFVGFLSTLICMEFDLSVGFTGAVAGVFGWLGASVSIQIIEKIVRKRLGLTDDTPEN